MKNILGFSIVVAILNGIVTAVIAYVILAHLTPRLKMGTVELYYVLFVGALIVINIIDYFLSASISTEFGVTERQVEFPIVIIAIQSALMALFVLLEYYIPQLTRITLLTSVLTIAVIPYIFTIYYAKSFDLTTEEGTLMLWFV